jgi:hypothetical protein
MDHPGADLDELAQVLGIPAEVLSRTMDCYNHGAQVGSDVNLGVAENR